MIGKQCVLQASFWGLVVVSVISISTVVWSLLGSIGSLAFVVAIISSSAALRLAISFLKSKGLIHRLSPKLRTVLLERSILDIFRDLVYFPYITKVIGFFVSVATLKPHPETITKLLKEQHPEISELTNRKGLLSLAPSAVEQLVLPPENRAGIAPPQYGQIDEQWYRIDEYNRVEGPPHEDSVGKKVVLFLDSKMGWPLAMTLLTMTLAGAYHMRIHKFRKMMIQNATFCCLILSVLSIAVKVKRRSAQKQLNLGPKAIQADPEHKD